MKVLKQCMIVLVCTLLICIKSSYAQHEQTYFPPNDPMVAEKLKQWGDFKFGLLMHWGPYAQWGIVESWSLCPEDEDWCTRRGHGAGDYFEYKKNYENLGKTFNPVKFNPEKWAKAAKHAGMKYVVFTTKHHDGFCMFDTKETGYKITNQEYAFGQNPKSNITLEVFNAFRKEGLWVGTYFSKPDWNCPYYWNPYFPPLDRNVNYNIKKYPLTWESYKTFTRNQIRELMSNYGRVDILWLDGGWVRPRKNEKPDWGREAQDQDIQMDSIAAMARKLQPGLIVVDRDVEGPNQNYLTPEQQIPAKPLPYPWETCMTMGNSWSHVNNDTYKSTRKLVHNLARIVSRGGNYLLNIGPDAQGEWDSAAYNRLNEIGNWLQVNGNAIYNTKPIAPYEIGKCVFTQNKNGRKYIVYLADENERKLPNTLEVPAEWGKMKKAHILGTNSGICTVKKSGNALLIETPANYSIQQVAIVIEVE